MAAVGDCLREQYALLQSDHTVTLAWETGSHFQNSDIRTAKALLWLARQTLGDR